MKFRLISRRYFRQVLFLTISVLLLLCLVASFILYTNAKRTTEKALADSEQDRANELLRRADVYLEEFVSKNTVFLSLNIPYEQISVEADYWTRTLYQRMVYSHLNASSYLDNIELCLGGQSMDATPVSHERSLGRYSVFQIYTTEELQWPYRFDLCSSNRFGTVSLAFTINGYQLSKEFLSFKSTGRKDYLVMSDGTVLLTNNKSAFFKNIEDIHPGLRDLAQSEADGLLRYESCYTSVSNTDKFGFRMITLVEQSVYTPQLYSLKTQALLMSLLLIILGCAISVFLTVRFYRPVNSMLNLLHTYIPDNLKDYENEIAFITQNVSKCITNGARMEKVLPQALSKMQEAQAAVLQHQINSHFLFNTLENIKAISVSELGIENEIEESIGLLNNIIRESIQNQIAIVPLSQEIDLAKSYLALMQLRFPGVAVEWQVDPHYLSCQVFKFSLQPVLENCFIHAFKNRQKQDNHISICVCAANADSYIIRITDNGCGMDAVTLENLRELLRSTDDRIGSHVGIRNVQNRIQTVFGEDYGIRIFSTPAETTVDICYPVTTPNE